MSLFLSLGELSKFDIMATQFTHNEDWDLQHDMVGDQPKPRKRQRAVKPVTRSKRYASDSADFHQKMSRFPAGGSSLQELLHPAKDIQLTLKANPEVLRRLRESVKYDIEGSDSYSGVCFNREAERSLDVTLEPLIDWSEIPSGKIFYHSHSADKDSVAQTILVKLSKFHDAGESCVFGHIEERLSKEDLQKIAELAGPQLNGKKIITDEEKVAKQKQYQNVREHLREHGDAILPRGRKSYCHVHGRLCLVDDVRRGTWAGLHPKRLRQSGGGVTCLGWSGAGKQLRFSDQSEPSHDLFI